MKIIKNSLVIAIAVVLFGAAAANKNTYQVHKDSAITITGTSTFHDWEEKTEGITGNCEINWNSDGSFDLTGASIGIDVHSIKGDKGTLMNNDTYEALKADKYPEIRMTVKEPVNAIPLKGKEDAITVKSTLAIAGVTKDVMLHMKVVSASRNDLTFEGTQLISLKDFEIIPPTALLGTVKTGDTIHINYKIKFNITSK